ncbi:phage antirepressor N-terminal domain-containing protein [Yersinia bercovieri]|uniref:phage antirepressor N-terminal domain-containing protein n=1 Tax=Yersinia bercovieri TaxID=634 RepID=UPI0025AB215D|nr:phage antirepressor N-terminal domain-containing protein [Yersinia bercovieri]MDN0103057.1 phage antirepressor N-terminal domain-containing protein [Yersinia bercovieri]
MTSIAIIEAVNTTAVQFHGQPIITAMVAGVAYVAMKPIVENLGLSWTSQHRKLMNSGDKYRYAHMSIPSKGGVQEMLCLPLRKLNGWLFSINPEKVRSDIRDKLIQYQEECFTVLHEYWTKGEVSKKTKTRQSTATQLTPLRQTAERLIATGLGKIYPDIWKLVHSRFDIEHIHQLQPHQVGEAIEYLNAIEGEYLGRETLPSDVNNPQFTDDELCSLSWLWLVADKMRSHAEITYPALRQLESKHAGAAYDISCEFNHWLRNTMQILIRETDHIGKSNRLVACEPALMHLRDHQWSTARK